LELNPPTFELFLKNDALGDPMVNESHVKSFGWATEEQLARMKALSFQVNTVLKDAVCGRQHVAGGLQAGVWPVSW
jgi:phosphoribosylaminoimidazole-succinocarboxamide synthase